MPPRKLEFRRSPAFRRAYRALSASQQEAAEKAFAIFRKDIFDVSLNNHIIQRLTTRYRTTVRAVWIEANLQATYCQQGNVILALDIGTHDIYR